MLDKPEDEIRNLFYETAESIGDFVWHDFQRSFLQKTYCICKKSFEDESTIEYTWIACDNMECSGELWYHVKCLKEAGRYVETGSSSESDSDVEFESEPNDDNSSTASSSSNESEEEVRARDTVDLDEVYEELIRDKKKIFFLYLLVVI